MGTHVGKRTGTIAYITAYLVAIVTANWAVSHYGPAISPFTALIGIGFVIFARDRLHDDWLDKHLKRNMFLLIVAGSLLSLPFNAGRVALASFAAFAVSETVDTLVYHRLLKQPKWLRINGSNVPSSLVDSIVFPLLAFGWPPLVGIMALQFGAKVLGGLLWSVLLNVKLRGRQNASQTGQA